MKALSAAPMELWGCLFNLGGANMLDEILNIDCLDGMKKIKSGSVDLIVCDLPYGITVRSRDAVIPFPDLWAEYKLIDNFTS